VLSRIDEILAWERATENPRDAKFVELERELTGRCLASTISSGQRRLFFPTQLASIAAVEAVGKW